MPPFKIIENTDVKWKKGRRNKRGNAGPATRKDGYFNVSNCATRTGEYSEVFWQIHLVSAKQVETIWILKEVYLKIKCDRFSKDTTKRP